MRDVREWVAPSFGVLLCGFLCCPATAQVASPAGQSERGEPTIPVFRTQANLVLVDVVVRDHGQPVHGLRRNDFQVFEDGVPQRVSVFEEHQATDTIEASGPPHLGADTYSDAQPYAIESAANVVLLDALNTPLQDQKYVRERLLEYLKTIPAGTRVAVFTLGSKLRIIEGFTTDSSVIERALEEKRGRPEVSPIMDPMLDQALSDAADLPDDGGAQAAMRQFAADTQSFQGYLRNAVTLDALTQLARYLSTIPGRKNLIWVVGSMPFAVDLTSGNNNATNNDTTTPTMNFTADFLDSVKKLEVLLTVARVAVYPIDAEGLIGVPSQMAETTILPPNLLYSGAPGEANNPVTFSQKLQGQDQSALYALQASHGEMDLFAKATGGQAFYNTNAIAGAVGDAIGIGENYYTLAYAPENRNYNGEFRKVVVKIPEGHYELEYRPGYFATDPAETPKLIPGRLTPLIAAMQHGSLPVSEVPFTVRVIPAAEDAAVAQAAGANPKAGGLLAGQLKGPVTRYLAEFSISPAGVDFRGPGQILSASGPGHTIANGMRHREIELTEVLYDAEGIRINYNDVGLSVDTPAAAEGNPEARIRLAQEIDVPAGESYLRLGVSDLMSGRIGTVEIELDVKK